MGFFSKKTNTSKEGKNEKENKSLNWIPITKVEQISELKEISRTKAVFIFKHSTRCGISRMVLKQFEKLCADHHNHLELYYLDLLNYRSLSDEIGYTFQVVHQSPQLLVIRNENAVYHASHYEITETDLSRFV